MAKAVQPAYLYSPYRNFYVYFDAIIDREVSLSATVPQYPTEKGTYFSESVLRRPRTLSITAFISDTLVTWRNKIPVDYVISRYESEKNNLERFYFDGQLLDFYSGGRKYKNVVIEKLSIPEVPEMINASENMTPHRHRYSLQKQRLPFFEKMLQTVNQRKQRCIKRQSWKYI